MLNLALTHDIDRTYKSYQYLTHFIRSLIKTDIRRALYEISSLITRNTYWNFDEIIRIENNYNVKSTFFFLNETIPFNLFNIGNWPLSLGRYDIIDEKVRDIILWLDAHGWEIGLHGSYRSYNHQKLLETEKQTLEGIVNHKVTGIRQHYLNLDVNTWKIQREVGFKYDSSFGYTEDIGFKDQKIKWFSPEMNDFIVFPQVIMDHPFMSKVNKWDEFEKILELSDEKNALLVINWHNDKFNENEFPGYKSAYIRIIERCIDKHARFYKMMDFYNITIS